MKDEEMAEEYKESKRHKCFRADVGKIQIDYEAYLNNLKDGFLAGLKAGRPQWHDLREDPNDLPKDDRYVLIATQKRVYLGFYDCCWFSHETDDIGDVIAWCEIPTFDKE